MIIDLILDRKDGCAYDPEKFREDCAGYNKSFSGIADKIVRAFDSGSEEAIKEALCSYIRENGYRHEIMDWVNEQSWTTRGFSKGFMDVLQGDERFRYMMLDRMRTDCEYYLGHGNRFAGHLWAGDEMFQIDYMKALWNSFGANRKPEWLSMDKILEYESRMLTQGVAKDGKVASATARVEFVRGDSLESMIQNATARANTSVEKSSPQTLQCKVTFCRTDGVSDGLKFHILMDYTPENYKDNTTSFCLTADDRTAAYDEAEKVLGKNPLSDFVILSAEMVPTKTAEPER